MGNLSVWILGDQLLIDHPAIAEAEKRVDTAQIYIVIIESAKRIMRLPYHYHKRILIISAMRHYAAHLREQGYTVDYIHADSMASGIRQHINARQPVAILTMAASEYHARQVQQALENLEVLPNTQFLVEQFNPKKQHVMEAFYRQMRQHFDVLVDAKGEPEGGEWNYDKLNRKPLPKDVEIPEPLRFPPDAITQGVIDEVEAAGGGVGNVAGFAYAVTHAHAQAALEQFITVMLNDFGPYEDAMTSRSSRLFHSVLSPYINIGLLTSIQVIRAAESAYRENDAPINSVEGFVRQVLGWREYMYNQYWRHMPQMAVANFWAAQRPMPSMFWDGKTDMNCIRHVVERVKADGYTHHIERLMIVSNFCLLAGINPQAVLEWFMSFYIDAYDWVMQPNVIGMGLYADGGKIATKPYIASANYINKMSDYCKGCRFKHTQRTGEDACPFNFLYWNFLISHEVTLRANPRMGPNVLGLRHLDDAERREVQTQAKQFLDGL